MQNTDLETWLRMDARNLNGYDFPTFDVTERAPRTQPPVRYLATIVGQFFFSSRVLQDLQTQLGELARSILADAMPSTQNLRKGVFGEALTAEIYERWHAYIVPLRKLRMTGGSPTGTDLLALRSEEDGRLAEVCYVECKLRTTRSDNTALDAHDQLQRARQERIPAIVRHVSNYLDDTRSRLYAPFLEYMASTANEPVLDTFRVALTWEENEWFEQVLVNLSEREGRLAPLTVDVIKLPDLRLLVDEVYGLLGVQGLNDGD